MLRLKDAMIKRCCVAQHHALRRQNSLNYNPVRLGKYIREGRFPDLRCRRQPTLAKTWRRTFRKDHAAEPGVTYISGRKPIFAAKAKVQTVLVASESTDGA